jgi:hypothetical protein
MARVGSGASGNGVPNPEEMLAQLSTDARVSYYGLSDEEVVGAYRQMGKQRTKGLVSPLASLPTAASAGEFYEAISIFEDDEESMGFYDPSRYNFDPSRGGTPMGYTGKDWRANRATPAPLTLVPTSTINPERPRTVAAGYDRKRQLLTVVFRDGTYYNYYDVTPNQWQMFKSRKSKGRYIAEELDAHPRGYADVSNLPDYAKESLYRITRTSQIVRSNRAKTAYRPWQQINRNGKLPYPKNGRKRK